MWVMSAIQAFRPKALRPKALLLAVPLGALGTLGAVWMSKKIGGETSPGFDVVKEGEHDEFEWVDSLATTPSVRSPNRRSIVFVHGLNPLGSTTHARDTWTANVMGKKVFWPEELLPISVPNARVLVLHYNSSISWNSGIADLEDHATLLMRWLKLKRKNSPKRPIVFICHSLGGLVVKQALLLTDTDFQDIINSTRGLVFFATPHRGATAGLVDIGFMCADVVRAIQGEGKSPLPSVLENQSRLADALARSFEEKLNKFRIISIYETRSMKGSGIIVSKTSAVLRVPHETRIPRNRNHSTVCKFDGAEDREYQLFIGCLKLTLQTINDAEEEVERDEELAKLRCLSPTDPTDDAEFRKLAKALARRYEAHQKYEESADLNGRILQWCDGNPRLGRNHEDAVRAAYNRGFALMSLSRFEEAVEMYDRAVEGWRYIAGDPGNIRVLDARRQRAKALGQSGKSAEAESELNEILEVLKNSGQKSASVSKVVLATEESLAFLHQTRGKWKEAENLLRHILQEKEKTGQDTLVTQHRLAFVLQSEGEDAESERQYRDLVANRKQKYRLPDKELFDMMDNFGDILRKRGKLREAEEQYEEVLRGLKQLHSAGRAQRRDVAGVSEKLARVRRQRDIRRDF